jgi:hypothetical protein
MWTPNASPSKTLRARGSAIREAADWWSFPRAAQPALMVVPGRTFNKP